MSYDTVATISQVASLLLFIGLFAGVLIYVLWPRNRERLEAAARTALDLDKEKSNSGGKR